VDRNPTAQPLKFVLLQDADCPTCIDDVGAIGKYGA